MEEHRVVVLGSTGSIGRQTLEVIASLNATGHNFVVLALAARRNVALLAEQAERFHPQFVALREADPRLEAELKAGLTALEPQPELLCGPEALTELASLPEADIVVNALVGAVGLPSTLAALRAGKRLCLANKESLVIGGHLVSAALKEDKGAELLPIDSEHNALFQLLEGHELAEVRKVILTASGGALRDLPLEGLWEVRPEEVLQHPNWRMGKRITVDSATLVNKAFEVNEAHWLFNLDYSRIEALIHPQSIVHGLVEFMDGTVTAALAPPDMRLPIQHALTYPERVSGNWARLQLPGLELGFQEIDAQRYPAFATVLEAGRLGGSAPAAVNAADEVLVERFLQGEIPFPKIGAGLAQLLEEHRPALIPEPNLEEILEVDRWARARAREL